MPREDVNIKVSANVAEAIQLWKAMEAGPDGMAKALSSMGDKGAKSAKSIGDELASQVGKWVTVGAAVAAVTQAINAQYEAVKRLREERTAATNTVDDAFNRFQVQANIPSGARADAVRTQLFQIIANRRAAPVPGLQAAEALGSAGATVEDITGGGLDEFLQMVTASNAAGKQVNQSELAASVVKFLKANNLAPNRQGMQGTSLAIQQLFGGTNLQASNLSRFARDAGSISSFSHMAPEDQLAQFSMLLDTMNEDTGSTAFKSGIISLATAGGNREKTRALTMLGLKPGDVDFQGEDWQSVYGRLGKGFAGVAPEKRNVAAKLLFGDEGLPFYTTFLEPGDLDEARKRGGMARDPAGAAERLGIAESGRGAQARQAETLAINAMYEKNNRDDAVVKQRLQALLGNFGADEATRASILGEYEDIPFWPDWAADTTPEGKARRAASRLTSGDPRYRFNPPGDQFPGLPGGQRTGPAARGYIEQQLLGERPIRIIAPDGLDVPHEPAASELGDAPAGASN